MQPPILTDDAPDGPLTLRALTRRDVDGVLELGLDPLVQRWTSAPAPYQRADAERFVADAAAGWQRGDRLTFAVEAAHEGRPRLAGSLRLRHCGRAADLGFALSPWARERGRMARAVRLALAWAFAQEPAGLDVDVVHWSAQVGNWDSRRVAWSCGFQVEGTVRGLRTQRGLQHDAWLGSIVRGDPLSPATGWLDVPHLYGDQVTLRPWQGADVPAVVEACRDEQTQRWLPQLPAPYTVADAQWYVGSREEQHADGSAINWCIADPRDDACLGSLTLTGLSGPVPQPQVGYWAHPGARRRGAVTDAVRLAIRHALLPREDGGLGQRRVILRAAAGNAASNRVAVRAGLHRYGLARGAERLRDGTIEDFVLYDAVPGDLAPADEPGADPQPGDDGPR